LPLADAILERLRAAGDAGLARTEIHNAVGRHRAADQLDAALAHLQEHRLAYMRTKETGGRPEERWFAGVDDKPAGDVVVEPGPPTGKSEVPPKDEGSRPADPAPSVEDAGPPPEAASEGASNVTAPEPKPNATASPTPSSEDVRAIRAELMRQGSRDAQTLARATNKSVAAVREALDGWAEREKLASGLVLYYPPTPRPGATP
jgi:hypothetical protein